MTQYRYTTVRVVVLPQRSTRSPQQAAPGSLASRPADLPGEEVWTYGSRNLVGHGRFLPAAPWPVAAYPFALTVLARVCAPVGSTVDRDAVHRFCSSQASDLSLQPDLLRAHAWVAERSSSRRSVICSSALGSCRYLPTEGIGSPSRLFQNMLTAQRVSSRSGKSSR